MSFNGQINGRWAWIHADGIQAIWYLPDHQIWMIGPKSHLGEDWGGLYSTCDTACPTDCGNKWNFVKDGNWVNAGNDAQVACGGK